MIGASVCGESSGRCCGCLPRCHGGQALSVDQMAPRSEEHTSELQSQSNLVCRLLLEKKEDIGQQPRSQSESLTLTHANGSFIAAHYMDNFHATKPSPLLPKPDCPLSPP